MKRINFRCACALILVISFLWTALPMARLTSSASEDTFAYQAPDNAYKEFTLSELILKIDGAYPGDAESQYLLSSGDSFRYLNCIPTSSVDTAYCDGILTVTAMPYSYTAVNGKKMQWIPDKLTVSQEKSVSFIKKNGGYIAQLFDADVSKELILTVHYRMTVTLDATVWAELANRAYYAGQKAVEAEKQYERIYEEYLSDITDYENYRAALITYEKEMAAYRDHLAAMEKYREELSEYRAFLEKKAVYDEAVADYQAYLQEKAEYDRTLEVYRAYLVKKQEYDALYPDYQKYLTACRAATDKLFVMDAIFLTDSEGHQMYATLMGDTVANVVSKKQQLIEQGGCDARDIDNAGNATVALKELLSAYKALKTDRERFAYYQAYYTDIRDYFILLYSSLNSLYKNGPVRAVLSSEGKLERYQNFIAHLYVLSTALDDETTLSYDWVVYKANKPLAEVLAAEQHLVDRNTADPSGTVYPECDMTLTAPDPVLMPTNLPEVVTEPTKTWAEELTEPTKPQTVAEPTKPQAVVYPDEPIKPVFGETVSALAQAVKDGTLTLRDTSKEAIFTLFTTVDLPLVPSDYPTVAFYDWDGTLLKTAVVESGSSADYGKDPKRPSTAKYHYTFSGWKNYDGTAVDLSNVRESLSVYASYKEELNRYTVKWKVEGKTETTTVPYGQLPIPPVTPTKASDAQYHYTFSGWSSPIEIVTAGAEYTAQFSKTVRAYTVTFRYLDQKTDFTMYYGDTPSAPIPPDEYSENGIRYRFEGWDKAVAQVSGDAVYTAVYKMIPPEKLTVEEKTNSFLVKTMENVCDMPTLIGMAMASGKGLELKMPEGTVSISTNAVNALSLLQEISLRKTDDGRYLLAVKTETGQIGALAEPVLVQLPYMGSENELITLYYKSESGEETEVPCNYTNGTISFWAMGMGEYRISAVYQVELNFTGSGTAHVDKTYAAMGETITVECFADPGNKIAKFIVTTADGKEVMTEGDFGFVMPQGAVEISVVFETIVYTVTFVVDGKVYEAQNYRYGDTVILPEAPSKEAEEGYLYTFSGWMPMVETVTKDVRYTAQFKKTVKEDPRDTYRSPYNSNKIFTVYLPIAGGILLLAGAVALFVRKKRRPFRSEK